MKTSGEILEQLYISPQDLKILVPTLGKNYCVKVVKEIREEMKAKKIFVPQSKPLLAQTNLIKKRFGIK